MADPKQPTPSGNDLAAIAAKYGIDPSSLLSGAGASNDDDPPIYLGKAPRSFDTELGRFHPTSTAKTQPLSEYSKQFYALDKNALILFQQRAQAAGLYGKNTPRFGDYDDDTYKVWQDVGVRAARFFAADQRLTVGDVLDMAAQSNSDDPQQVYGTRTDVVNLQDPATIREAAHQAFKAVTGKGGATDDAKVRKFVQTFTAAQLAAQRGVNRAQDRAEAATRAAQESGGQSGPMSQEVDLTMPDLGSRAQEFAAAQDPAGAGATKVADKFASFIKLLGGVV